MQDRKLKFLCCTGKQISISSCPSCKRLFGYCHSCSTLFHNLEDLSMTSVIPKGGELTCISCQYFFPVADIPKYTATQEEISQAGLTRLLNEEGLQFKKEEGSGFKKEEDSGSDDELSSTISGEDSPKMRCGKCGNKVSVNALSCPKCGMQTPLGRSTGGLKSSTTGVRSSSGIKSASGVKTASKTRRDQEKKSRNWMPKFIKDLPLAKISVSPRLAVTLAIFIPLAALAYYFYTTSMICFDCVQVGGKYSTDLNVDGKKVRMDLLLYQYKAGINGQVVFTPVLEQPAEGPKLPPKQFVEIIESGQVQKNGVTFKTYERDSNRSRVQFKGQFTEDNVLKGDLQVTMPEFNYIGKTFPISVQKS